MRSEVLTEASRPLFPKLSAFADGFYLAGGTALALQIGHRVSIDFDLFSDSAIKKNLIADVEKAFKDMSVQSLVNNRDELTTMIGGVKCTFLHYPFPPLLPLTLLGSLPALPVKEILATKAYTIGRRGEFKDYIDLYVGLRDGYSVLREIMEIAGKKYGEAFNDRLFLEQLIYLDDIEEVPVTMMTDAIPTKSAMASYFSALTRTSGLV